MVGQSEADGLQRLREEPAVRNLDISSYLLVPSKEDPFMLLVEFIMICFSVQRITRYPLLIKQILQYTEPDQDRELTERALHTAVRILNAINEAIREQEGRDRLRTLSQDLWIGHG